MKKISIFISVLLMAGVLLCGCANGGGGAAEPSAAKEQAPADSVAANNSAPATLNEVLGGTWKLYAGFDAGGNLVHVSDGAAEISYTFDANGGFTGVYRDGDGFLDASFSGGYDCSDSKSSEKDPYKWVYYATIDEKSIQNAGTMSYLSKMGQEGLHLIFNFRESDGEQLLYEDTQRLYFKK